MNAQEILRIKYGDEIAQAIIDTYKEIESNFKLAKWKASELDAGHFVEAVRRLLEQELFGTFTPFSQKISSFTDQVLLQYENAQNKDESYRILIPRVLKAIYGIRNKRGVGHISAISPNKMDSTYILYSVKWVLAELLRLNSGQSTIETQKMIDEIVDRQISVIWKTKNFVRLTNTKVSAKDQILILLYDQSPLSDETLINVIEYTNKSEFRKILKRMHSERKIEYQNTGLCYISPPGEIIAEALLQKIGSL